MSRSTYLARTFVAIACLCGRIIQAQQSPVPRAEDRDCRMLSVFAWYMVESQESRPARATTVIRLDTVALPRGAPGDLSAVRIEPADVFDPSDARARRLGPARWRREGTDSVVIVSWSTNTEAEAFMGHRVGATLEGVVRRTNDAIPMDPETKTIRWDAWPFAARRRRPSPAREAASSARGCCLTSVAADKGMAVRCVTAQHSVLLRSQLIYYSLCSRTRR